MDGISAFDLKHNFVVSYNYDLPVARLWRPNRLTSGWALSGITRFATGVPVTFASFGDNYLVQVQNNGVNAKSIDMPNFYGPGIDNYDMALHEVTNLTEARSLELRLETFNVFNHAQFDGGNSLDGNIGNQGSTFGFVNKAADPGIDQIAAKFRF